MPKRLRRRFTTPKQRKVHSGTGRYEVIERDENMECTPRGRLKGALKDALEPGAEDSDVSGENTPAKRNSRKRRSSSTSDDENSNRRPAPQSYVLKLFDRSVDLSQFDEDSPLYPICRAWILNKPKINYRKYGRKKYNPPEPTADSVELPGPAGPPVSRIPPLLPEQERRSKDNISLDYESAPPPPGPLLLAQHLSRWTAVRQGWLEQARRAEARYRHTQQLLNKINITAL